jgi:predicted ATPase
VLSNSVHRWSVKRLGERWPRLLGRGVPRFAPWRHTAPVPIDDVEVQNFRSIQDTGKLQLGAITLLIGENNAGKSALLRAMYMVQATGGIVEPDDIRIGTDQIGVRFSVSEPYPTGIEVALRVGGLGIGGRISLSAWRDHETGAVSVDWPTDSQRASRGVAISPRRPNHLVAPFFARRKGGRYETVVRRDLAQEVDTTDRNLTSQIADLASGDHGPGRRYRALVEQVLGLNVGTFLTDEGQVPGQAVGLGQGISLSRMGEGVSSVVGILAELASPGRRLFLIEEPENDLHPKSLRALLEVLSGAVDAGHQFVVTTHSDIVLRSLGARDDTRIYRVEASSDSAGLPVSAYRPLDGHLDREEALLELGYEQTAPYGWLLLEEASGETFVRDVVIPLFVPKLAILRTVSAGGAGNLAKRLDGLNSMLLFAHLSADTRRAWVIADGDDAGRAAVARLRGGYSSWPEDRFQTLSLPDIEGYYPSRFGDKVAEIQREGDSRRATRLKGDLARQVREWSVGSGDARAELEESAAELIELLRRVEATLTGS